MDSSTQFLATMYSLCYSSRNFFSFPTDAVLQRAIIEQFQQVDNPDITFWTENGIAQKSNCIMWFPYFLV
ncbi:MAG: hypothetical protein AYK19_00180 [Theionarchaea archaeon DG-70-1]|nr:MAG: hypothetical protein AYK19_00180 [Theionarchaea archaeon DG-70-1]